MSDLKLMEKVKIISESSLANRTVRILKLSQSGESLQADDKKTLERALNLLESSLYGLSFLEGRSSQKGFVYWKNSLSAYRITFDAMLRKKMIKKAEEVRQVLEKSKNQISGILKDQKTDCNDAYELFQGIAEERSRSASAAFSSPSIKVFNL